MSCMDVSMCLTIDCCIPFIHDLRDFVNVYVNQLNRYMLPIEGIDEIPLWDLIYTLNRYMLPIEGIDEIPQRDQSYINVMHRLSLVDVQWKEKF